MSMHFFGMAQPALKLGLLPGGVRVGNAHQPVNFGGVADGGQQCSCHQVGDLGRLLVNEVGHFLLCRQDPPGSTDDDADEVRAHLLCPGGAQHAVLPILYQAELPGAVHQAHLAEPTALSEATLLWNSFRLSRHTHLVRSRPGQA